MIKKMPAVFVALFICFCAAPAAADLKSDYLTAQGEKLPEKTYDLVQKARKETLYGDRTAGGKKTGKIKHRSKKQRRADRRKLAQKKKTEARFGTFNQ